MIIIDKAKWQINGGLSQEVAGNHFFTIFNWLKENNLLTQQGKEELFEAHKNPDSIFEMVLSEETVNNEGIRFLTRQYSRYCSILENKGKFGEDTGARTLNALWKAHKHALKGPFNKKKITNIVWVCIAVVFLALAIYAELTVETAQSGLLIVVTLITLGLIYPAIYLGLGIGTWVTSSVKSYYADDSNFPQYEYDENYDYITDYQPNEAMLFLDPFHNLSNLEFGMHRHEVREIVGEFSEIPNNSEFQRCSSDSFSKFDCFYDIFNDSERLVGVMVRDELKVALPDGKIIFPISEEKFNALAEDAVLNFQGEKQTYIPSLGILAYMYGGETSTLTLGDENYFDKML